MWLNTLKMRFCGGKVTECAERLCLVGLLVFEEQDRAEAAEKDCDRARAFTR